jgi:hypothetical protein
MFARTMFARNVTRLLLSSALLLRVGLLVRGAILAAKPTPEPKKPSATEILGGANRFLTHVSTDKPIYRPGETVYIRGVVLHANSRKPLDQAKQTTAQIQVTGPKGNIISMRSRP